MKTETALVPAGHGWRRRINLGAIWRMLLAYLGLALLDVFAIYLTLAFASDGVWELAIAVALITLLVNVINLRRDLYPLRWISPALALMSLLVVFPILYTVYVSLTNFGDGNLLTKQQVIKRLAQELYLPEGGKVYSWQLYQNEAGDLALWLADDNAGGAPSFATLGDIQPVTDLAAADDPPQTYQGYRQLERGEALRASREAQQLTFGDADQRIGIAGRKQAGEFAQRYVFRADADAIHDRQTDSLYYANYETGQFENDQGDTLLTGFISAIGIKNYLRFVASPLISGPLARIFVWTIGFSLASVISTFTVGLFFALLLQNRRIPFRKGFRTLLIVPYAIPGLISVGIWKGMLNANLGVIPNALSAIGLQPPPFFTDPGWAKFGILLVNLWLGYPYFMLVCSGALASIPRDMYEAAEVDGANAWDRFYALTLPLLLVAVGPLLIASFTYNFNNFVIIESYNEGGPPMEESGTVPAGHTDILISYAFRWAFGGGRGADFGLASAITIIIFALVAAVTLLQFRVTKGWEETSQNV